jgi:hypothetical protein
MHRTMMMEHESVDDKKRLGKKMSAILEVMGSSAGSRGTAWIPNDPVVPLNQLNRRR